MNHHYRFIVIIIVLIGLNKQVNLILMSTFYEQLAQICE